MTITEYDEMEGMEGHIEDVPYELEEFDKKSLSEIKDMISGNLYENGKTVEEHLTFLEHLISKCEETIRNELEGGEGVGHLQRDLTRIKKIYDELTKIGEKF